jgi:hypothetical protein
MFVVFNIQFLRPLRCRTTTLSDRCTVRSQTAELAGCRGVKCNGGGAAVFSGRVSCDLYTPSKCNRCAIDVIRQTRREPVENP